jgi:dTDP-4-dehydrorhamnose reductase
MHEMTERVFLITGAAGYLGRRLVAAAGSKGRVVAAGHRSTAGLPCDANAAVDVMDRSSVLRLMREVRPTEVIHAAAVNPGQGGADLMWRVNVDGSRHVAEACADVGARLVAISTDIVHDGRLGPYADDAPAKPINPYGRSKAAGELVVRALNPAAAIVRTSLMYGLDAIDRGTAGFADRLARGEPLILFSDVLRSPIEVDTLANAVVRLAASDYAGYLNVAGRQAVSRDAFGRAMLRYWRVPTGDRVRTGRAAEVSDTIPLDLRLSVHRAEELLGIRLPGVDETLAAARSRGHRPADR